MDTDLIAILGQILTLALAGFWARDAYDRGHRRGFSAAMRLCADCSSDSRALAKMYAGLYDERTP